jgi:hypothetical protein
MFSKAMGSPGGDDEATRADPNCQCTTVAAALLCRTGHLLECHFPQSCESAQCSHWQRNQEPAASVADTGQCQTVT